MNEQTDLRMNCAITTEEEMTLAPGYSGAKPNDWERREQPNGLFMHHHSLSIFHCTYSSLEYSEILRDCWNVLGWDVPLNHTSEFKDMEGFGKHWVSCLLFQ